MKNIIRIYELDKMLTGITVGDASAIADGLHGSICFEHFFCYFLGKYTNLHELAKTKLQIEAAHGYRVRFFGGPNGNTQYVGTLKMFLMDRILQCSQWNSYPELCKKIVSILDSYSKVC